MTARFDGASSARRLLDDAAQLERARRPARRSGRRSRTTRSPRAHLLQRDHAIRRARSCTSSIARSSAAVVDHEVVGEQHRERLVADVVTRHRHRVAEAERLALAHVVDVGEVGRELHLLQQVVLARRARGSARARSCGRSGPRSARLLRPVMMRMSVRPACTASSTTYWIAGLVDDRQHLLRRALGRGQEARPEPRGGDHGLANWVHSTSFRTQIVLLAPQQPPDVAPRGAARSSTASAAEDRDLPQVVARQRRRRPGTAPCTSNDASDALCNSRATTNHTTARPTTINGYSTTSTPPRRSRRPCRPCGTAGTCGRRSPRARARTRRAGRRPEPDARGAPRPWRSRGGARRRPQRQPSRRPTFDAPGLPEPSRE